MSLNSNLISIVLPFFSMPTLYRKMVNGLKTDKLEFNTYQLHDDRLHRLVLSVHQSMSPNVIKGSSQECYEVINNTIVDSRNKPPLPLFFIGISKNYNKINDVFKLSNLCISICLRRSPK